MDSGLAMDRLTAARAWRVPDSEAAQAISATGVAPDPARMPRVGSGLPRSLNRIDSTRTQHTQTAPRGPSKVGPGPGTWPSVRPRTRAKSSRTHLSVVACHSASGWVV